MTWLTAVMVLGGLVLLVAGGEALVRGASALGRRAGLSSLVVGLTIVSLATSAPELAVTVDAVLSGSPDIAVGNVVGSNIANVLLVLACGALVTALVVSDSLLRFDLPVLVGLSGLFWLLGRDGHIGPWDGALLLAVAAAHMTISVIRSRRTAPKRAAAADPSEKPDSLPVALLLVAAGIALLVLGARWLVAGATEIALSLGVTELVIGLTVVAIGTSLPELAATVIAVRRGERDLAIGNVVGSNIANLGVVMGLPALLGPFVSDQGIPVPSAAVALDIPLMIAVAVVLWAIGYTGRELVRWEAALLLLLYAAYTTYVLLAAADHDAQQGFSVTMTLFVLPLLLLALVVLVMREWRRRRTLRAARQAARTARGIPPR